MFERLRRFVTKCPEELTKHERYDLFFKELGTPANLREVVGVFRKLTPDQYLTRNIEVFERRANRQEPFWEMCCVLNLAARMLLPSRYLEIGVRRGRSAAQVAAQTSRCEIVGFDMWIPNYSGESNPGPEFVREEILRLGYHGELDLIHGNSHVTVPDYFERHAGRLFDLITVDGDHSEQGARADLAAVVDHVATGGMLVFDDIRLKDHRLFRTWRWFKRRYGAWFWFVENWRDMHGTAMAIRR